MNQLTDAQIENWSTMPSRENLMLERKDNGYVSGGAQYGETCLTCDYRYPDPQSYGFGWCVLRDWASVSCTGQCSWHSDNDATEVSHA